MKSWHLIYFSFWSELHMAWVTAKSDQTYSQVVLVLLYNLFYHPEGIQQVEVARTRRWHHHRHGSVVIWATPRYKKNYPPLIMLDSVNKRFPWDTYPMKLIKWYIFLHIWKTLNDTHWLNFQIKFQKKVYFSRIFDWPNKWHFLILSLKFGSNETN